jgi:hypothetical protein
MDTGHLPSFTYHEIINGLKIALIYVGIIIPSLVIERELMGDSRTGLLLAYACIIAFIWGIVSKITVEYLVFIILPLAAQISLSVSSLLPAVGPAERWPADLARSQWIQ